jgi:hypothetical protein
MVRAGDHCSDTLSPIMGSPVAGCNAEMHTSPSRCATTMNSIVCLPWHPTHVSALVNVRMPHRRDEEHLRGLHRVVWGEPEHRLERAKLVQRVFGPNDDATPLVPAFLRGGVSRDPGGRVPREGLELRTEAPHGPLGEAAPRGEGSHSRVPSTWLGFPERLCRTQKAMEALKSFVREVRTSPPTDAAQTVELVETASALCVEAMRAGEASDSVSIALVGAVASALELVVAFGVSAPAELGVCPSPARREGLLALKLPKMCLADLRRLLRAPGEELQRTRVLLATSASLCTVLSSPHCHPVILRRFVPDCIRAAVQSRECPLPTASSRNRDAIKSLWKVLDCMPSADRASCILEAMGSGKGATAPPPWFAHALQGIMGASLAEPGPKASAKWWDDETVLAQWQGGVAGTIVALLQDVNDQNLAAARHRLASAISAPALLTDSPCCIDWGAGAVSSPLPHPKDMLQGAARSIVSQLLSLALLDRAGSGNALVRDSACLCLAKLVETRRAREGDEWAFALANPIDVDWVGPLMALGGRQARYDGRCDSGHVEAMLETLTRVLRLAPISGQFSSTLIAGLLRLLHAADLNSRKSLRRSCMVLLQLIIDQCDPVEAFARSLTSVAAKHSNKHALPDDGGGLSVVTATVERACDALGGFVSLVEDEAGRNDAFVCKVLVALHRKQSLSRAALKVSLRRVGMDLGELQIASIVPMSGDESVFRLRQRVALEVQVCASLFERYGMLLTEQPVLGAECARLLLERGLSAPDEDDLEELSGAIQGVPLALALLASLVESDAPDESVEKELRQCAPLLSRLTDGPKLPDGTALFPPEILEVALGLRMSLVRYVARQFSSSASAGDAVRLEAAAEEVTAMLASKSLEDTHRAVDSAEACALLDTAMSLLRLPEPALQGGGLQELTRLFRSPHLCSALEAAQVTDTLSIVLGALRHEDPFVYCNAIDALAAMVDVRVDVAMVPLLRVFARSSAPLEARTRLADVVSKAARRCGETLPRFAPLIVAACLRSATRGGEGVDADLACRLNDAEFRAAHLACLGTTMVVLGKGLRPFLRECVDALASILREEERRATLLAKPAETEADAVLARCSVLVRRGAVLALADIAQGLPEEGLAQAWEGVTELHRSLAQWSSESTDQIVRGHASTAIARLRSRIVASVRGESARAKTMVLGLNPRIE